MFTPGQKCSVCGEKLDRAIGVAKIMLGWNDRVDVLCRTCWRKLLTNAHFGKVLREEIRQTTGANPFTLEPELPA